MLITQIEISDDAGHGPFKLVVKAKIVAAAREDRRASRREEPQRRRASPSRPDMIEVKNGPDASAAHDREGAGHEPPAARGQ